MDTLLRALPYYILTVAALGTMTVVVLSVQRGMYPRRFLILGAGQLMLALAFFLIAATADPAATTMPIRFAAGGGRHAVGGVAGGIPFVDLNHPLRLGADPTPPLFAAATAPTDGVRPSRLITAATTGAPAMPLPMVDGGTVVRPSRIFIGAAAASPDAAAPSGLVATGAARVETVSIAPAPAASSAAGSARPLLPPVPGETVDAAAPSVPTTAARSSSRSHRPLDLLGLQRRALTGG
mgnify:CR=1 FL=1